MQLSAIQVNDKTNIKCNRKHNQDTYNQGCAYLYVPKS